MIKGVNKKVIEINNPESLYFDKVILYIKPNKEIRSRSELSNEVTRYLNTISNTKDIKKVKKIKKEFIQQAPILLCMAIILMILIAIILI